MGILITLGLALLLAFWAAASSGLLWRTRRLSASERATLAKYAISYQRAHAKDKARMERIVATMVHDKEWLGVGLEVADEMKVMIGACAAQLLVGHSDLVLKHFERFVIYPDSYRDRRTGGMRQGEVRPAAGTIVISWDDFVNGYAHTRDAHNVGLHELAHALWFENSIVNGEDHFLPPVLLQRWNTLAEAEMGRIRAQAPSFFRDYAGTNAAEFFAVAVEYFFERPLEFRESLPEHYAVLCSLLKQDPAATLVLN
ncbi:MAG: zinc-dependent peptidase [Flavobacteriales bacterium]|nr:zinc-dependent peptidase [Flavobacteriales bacterium]